MLLKKNTLTGVLLFSMRKRLGNDPVQRDWQRQPPDNLQTIYQKDSEHTHTAITMQHGQEQVRVSKMSMRMRLKNKEIAYTFPACVFFFIGACMDLTKTSGIGLRQRSVLNVYFKCDDVFFLRF